jgi:ribosomal protein S18 acetylase RimI-like enzyme
VNKTIGGKIMNEITIVPYQNEDMDTIHRLLLESFHGKFHSLVNLNDEDISELLSKTWIYQSDHPTKKQMVIQEDGKIIGTILLKWKSGNSARNSEEGIHFKQFVNRFGLINVCKFFIGMGFLDHRPQEQECYIDHIAIHSSYRNKGIGQMILKWAKNFVHHHHELKRLTLFVSDNNKNAIHVYQKSGFCIEESKYSLTRHLLFKEPNWSFMTWQASDILGVEI